MLHEQQLMIDKLSDKVNNLLTIISTQKYTDNERNGNIENIEIQITPDFTQQTFELLTHLNQKFDKMFPAKPEITKEQIINNYPC